MENTYSQKIEKYLSLHILLQMFNNITIMSQTFELYTLGHNKAFDEITIIIGKFGFKIIHQKTNPNITENISIMYGSKKCDNMIYFVTFYIVFRTFFMNQ